MIDPRTQTPTAENPNPSARSDWSVLLRLEGLEELAADVEESFEDERELEGYIYSKGISSGAQVTWYIFF